MKRDWKAGSKAGIYQPNGGGRNLPFSSSVFPHPQNHVQRPESRNWSLCSVAWIGTSVYETCGAAELHPHTDRSWLLATEYLNVLSISMLTVRYDRMCILHKRPL